MPIKVDLGADEEADHDPLMPLDDTASDEADAPTIEGADDDDDDLELEDEEDEDEDDGDEEAEADPEK